MIARLPGSLALLWALALLAGCAHSIEFRSVPEGAEVLVEQKPIGKTPARFEEKTSEERLYAVEVRDPARGEVAVFHVRKGAFAWEPVLAVAGTGAGACAGIAALAFVGGAGSLLVPPCGIWASVGIPAAIVAGLVGLTFPFVGAGVAWWLFGNQGPDAVTVDFEAQRVMTSPPGLVQGTAFRASRWQPHPSGEEEQRPPPKDAPDAEPPPEELKDPGDETAFRY